MRKGLHRVKPVISDDDLENLIDIAIFAVTDDTMPGGAWFETEDEADEAMGDWFFDAVCAILSDGLGYTFENHLE